MNRKCVLLVLLVTIYLCPVSCAPTTTTTTSTTPPELSTPSTEKTLEVEPEISTAQPVDVQITTHSTSKPETPLTTEKAPESTVAAEVSTTQSVPTVLPPTTTERAPIIPDNPSVPISAFDVPLTMTVSTESAVSIPPLNPQEAPALLEVGQQLGGRQLTL